MRKQILTGKLSFHPSSTSSIHPSIHPSSVLSVYLSFLPSIHLPIHPSSVPRSMHLSLLPCFLLPFPVFLSSVYPSIYSSTFFSSLLSIQHLSSAHMAQAQQSPPGPRTSKRPRNAPPLWSSPRSTACLQECGLGGPEAFLTCAPSPQPTFLASQRPDRLCPVSQ